MFGVKVLNLLVENFSQSFFVGGMVRDIILNKNIYDIDIATIAEPTKVIKILKDNNINYIETYKNYGNVTAMEGDLSVEITTFRKDLVGKNRYSEVKYVKTPKEDSKRRDFTINSLYLSLNSGEILDFQKGLTDIKKHQIKFIGLPKTRIKRDPLRIIRALRFALVLNLKLERKTKLSIKNNFILIDNLTKIKIKKEINKIYDIKKRKILEEVINKPKLLDKYFK